MIEGQQPIAKTERDVTGRDRIFSNVLASWGGHAIFVIAGFVLPRVIDNKLGQSALGIWDFGWSLISYFGVAQLGIGASVDPYVAKYRAVQDNDQLNGAVSSVMCVQLVAALVVAVLTMVAVLVLPFFFQVRLGTFLSETRWVVLFLGFGLAVQVATASFGGVMTGCHRWDLHHAINAGFYGLTVIVMVISLLSGAGLRGLALASLVGTTLTEGTRVVVAYRVCPELRLRWRYVNWSQITELFTFGTKVVIGSFSSLLVYQTTNLLIVGYLGAGALAMYARSLALVRHCALFVEKFASVLTPTASSMHAGGQREELQTFLLKYAHYSTAMALPPILFLVFLGGPVLHLWMGPHYAAGEVIALLALGNLMSIANAPLWTILRGVNKHGLPAIIRLFAACIVAILTWSTLNTSQSGLVGIALSVTIPLACIDGIFLPIYACRQFGISFSQYVKYAWGTPCLYVLPFVGCLIIVRHLYAEQPFLALCWGILTGGISLGIVYWWFVLPDSIRERVRLKVFRSRPYTLLPVDTSDN